MLRGEHLVPWLRGNTPAPGMDLAPHLTPRRLPNCPGAKGPARVAPTSYTCSAPTISGPTLLTLAGPTIYTTIKRAWK